MVMKKDQFVAMCNVGMALLFGALLGACTAAVSGTEPGPGGANTGNGTPSAGASGTGNTGTGSAGTGSTGTGSTGTGSAGTGSAGTGSTGGLGGLKNPPPFAPAGAAVKRLTTTQFRNSLTALLGNVTVSEVEPDLWLDGFATVGASAIATSDRGVEQYQVAIDGATQQVFADKTRRDALLGCTPSATDASCYKSFVTQFGRRSWRKPLTAAQVDRYTSLATSLATSLGDPIEAARMTANALLESPYFLYRSERGEADPSSKFWRFTSHEMAWRLSYFLTNSPPDAALVTAADKGDLTAVESVKTQAARLLATPAGRQSIGNFTDELLEVSLIAATAKDAAFAAYTPGLQGAMAREASSMMQALVFDRNADAMEMFTTRQTYVNKELAALYGLATVGMTSSTWQPATLPEGARAGLLGTAGFLSVYANQKFGSPTLRGKAIRNLFMCQDVPSPPADVTPAFEDPPSGVVRTRREALELHRTSPSCSACHGLMDPMGLPLEAFDAIGAFRTTDSGKALDLTGQIAITKADGSAQTIPFDGPAQLGQALAQLPDTAACLTRNLYRYSVGRSLGDGEAKVLADLTTAFNMNQRHIGDLMVQIVTSDGFRYVAPSL